MIKKLIGSAALTAAVIAMTAPVSAQVIEDFESYADTAALTAVWAAGENTVLELAAENAPGTAGTNSLKIIGNIPDIIWSTCTAGGPQTAALDFTDKVLGLSINADGAVITAGASYKDFFIYFYEAGAESTNFGRVPASADAFTAGWADFTVDPSTLSKPWNAAALPDITNISQIAIVVYCQGDAPAVSAYTAEFLVDDITVQDPPPPPAPDAVYTVVETASAPTIDGIIGSGEWDAAGAGCTDFTVIETTTPATEAVTVKTLWDATNLYVLWTGPNADLGRTDNPSANDVRPDGDAENIILFPNGPNSSEYYRIILAPNPTSGVMYTATNAYDAAGLIGDNSDPSYWNMWTPTITGAFDYTAGIMTMEISIPWADFDYFPVTKDGLPDNGTMWGVQLADSNSAGYYAWGPALATNYIGVTPKNGWQFGDVSSIDAWNLYD